jgi:hypothetical protein
MNTPQLTDNPPPQDTVTLSAREVADYSDLATGTAYPFSEWPNPEVPTFGAGVYTIWHHDGRFIYVGMSGRGMTADTEYRNKPQGIYTRLQSHASGRRSGDQSAFTWLIDGGRPST